MSGFIFPVSITAAPGCSQRVFFRSQSICHRRLDIVDMREAVAQDEMALNMLKASDPFLDEKIEAAQIGPKRYEKDLATLSSFYEELIPLWMPRFKAARAQITAGKSSGDSTQYAAAVSLNAIIRGETELIEDLETKILFSLSMLNQHQAELARYKHHREEIRQLEEKIERGMADWLAAKKIWIVECQYHISHLDD